MTSWEFPADASIDLQIRIPTGNIAVTAVPTGSATVSAVPSRPGRKGEEFLAATRVEYTDGRLTVAAPDRVGLRGGSSLDVTVHLPASSSCQVITASADVRCDGELRSLDTQTASGDLTADRVSGQARISSASGAVRLESVGEVQAGTISGNVHIGAAAGDVSVRTTSGSVTVGAVAGGRTDIESVSGDISVAVAPGNGIYLDVSTVSGIASNELDSRPESEDVTVTLGCRTVSGNVRVGRAAPAAAS